MLTHRPTTSFFGAGFGSGSGSPTEVAPHRAGSRLPGSHWRYVHPRHAAATWKRSRKTGMPLGAQLFEAAVVELRVQLPDAPQRLRGLIVGHGRKVDCSSSRQRCTPCGRSSRIRSISVTRCGVTLSRHSAPVDLERGHRAQQHRPLRGLRDQPLAAAARVAPARLEHAGGVVGALEEGADVCEVQRLVAQHRAGGDAARRGARGT